MARDEPVAPEAVRPGGDGAARDDPQEGGNPAPAGSDQRAQEERARCHGREVMTEQEVTLCRNVIPLVEAGVGGSTILFV